MMRSRIDMEPIMTDLSSGDIVRPSHCQVSASPDRTRIALTFRAEDHAPVTLVLPVEGAVGLQRRLAQSLYILTASARQSGQGDAAAPASAPAAVPAE
jgi:hypothetical protein